MKANGLSIESVARRLLGDLNRACSTKTVWRYGTKGSLAVDLMQNTWFDHEDGEGGGVLDLVCRARSGSRRDAAAWLRTEGLVADDDQRPYRPKPDRRSDALALWEVSRPALYSPVQEYLACRGIVIQPPACLRYHEGIHAVVAAVQQCDGTMSGVQRIYLKSDSAGTWKRARLSLGPIKGGAVRLTPAAEALQLCESVEDGLALLQMTGKPTWAVPGAGFMQSFKAPPEVRELVQAPDNDTAGLAAIEATIKASPETNLQLRRLLPPPGLDWCDLLDTLEERIAIEEEPASARTWVEEFVDGV